MRWADVTAKPSHKTLRQFGGLCFVVFGLFAVLRVWRGDTGTTTMTLAAAGVVLGILGLVAPAALRYVYTGWMIAAFPIGWTVSRVIVTLLFYLVFTPFSIVFKLIGRDALHRRRQSTPTYWVPAERAGSAESYFSQF